jgi:hypothetical protein
MTKQTLSGFVSYSTEVEVNQKVAKKTLGQDYSGMP